MLHRMRNLSRPYSPAASKTENYFHETPDMGGFLATDYTLTEEAIIPCTCASCNHRTASPLSSLGKRSDAREHQSFALDHTGGASATLRQGKIMETFHYLIGQETPHLAWWQMAIRAAIIFIYGVSLYRLAPRRSFAGLSAFDIVLTVVMGSSLSRALTGNAPLLPTLVATALLIALHALLSALASKSETLSLLVKGRPIRLVHEGAVDWAATRRSQLGKRDLNEQLRMKGIRALDEVKEAYLERNGSISIIRSSENRGRMTGSPD